MRVFFATIGRLLLLCVLAGLALQLYFLLRVGLMTEIAIRDPEHVGIASPMLAHRTHTTGARHYNLARQHEAARQWQQHVLKLRKAARRR